jgi:hypothetical protein
VLHAWAHAPPMTPASLCSHSRVRETRVSTRGEGDRARENTAATKGQGVRWAVMLNVQNMVAGLWVAASWPAHNATRRRFRGWC